MIKQVETPAYFRSWLAPVLTKMRSQISESSQPAMTAAIKLAVEEMNAAVSAIGIDSADRLRQAPLLYSMSSL
jgi:hypothetical protein